jgi:hypothetical protein
MNLDNLVVVRTYAGEIEASLAASRLGSEGIGVHIHKDDVGGAYPPLQMAGGVRLLVSPDDLERAKKILDKAERDSREFEPLEPQEAEKKTKLNPAVILRRSFLFLAGLAAGYFLAPPEPRCRSKYTGVRKEDWKDGKPGATAYYVDGQLVRLEEDRNYDGKPDAWYKYKADKTISAEYDNNFDADPDVWVTYEDRFNFIEKYDTDFDGKPDVTIFYVNDVKKRVDWYPGDSPIIERRELYEHGVLKEKLVDTDGDGYFDLKITYDAYERPIGEAKVRIQS